MSNFIKKSEAKDLVAYVFSKHVGEIGGKCYSKMLKATLKEIDRAPSYKFIDSKMQRGRCINKPDIVEVVRCKDCINRSDCSVPNEEYCEWHQSFVKRNDFCSYGKKYEDVNKKAKWIDNSTGTLKTVKCSACGNTFQGYYENYPYCPRCGKKMGN